MENWWLCPYWATDSEETTRPTKKESKEGQIWGKKKSLHQEDYQRKNLKWLVQFASKSAIIGDLVRIKVDYQVVEMWGHMLNLCNHKLGQAFIMNHIHRNNNQYNIFINNFVVLCHYFVDYSNFLNNPLQECQVFSLKGEKGLHQGTWRTLNQACLRKLLRYKHCFCEIMLTCFVMILYDSLCCKPRTIICQL